MQPLSCHILPAIFNREFFHSGTKIVRHINLFGRTALVTGATGHLGLEAARHLVKVWASRVILTARTQSKGETVAAELRSALPKTNTCV